MKRLFCILIMLILMISNSVYAANRMDLTTDSLIVNEGDAINITFSMVELDQFDRGINVIKGKLNYDVTLLEKIDEDDFTTLNNWSNILYNTDTKEFILINDNDIEDYQDVFTLTIKLKDSINVSKVSLSLSNIQISEGNEDISVDDAKIELKVNGKDDEVIVIPSKEDDKNDNITSNTEEEITDTNVVNIPKLEDEDKENMVTIDVEVPSTSKNSYLWIPVVLVFIVFIILGILKKTKYLKVITLGLISAAILASVIGGGMSIATLLANSLSTSVIGDVNNDGLLTEDDTLILEKYLIHLSELSDKEKEFADINEDEMVTITDLSLLIRLVKNFIYDIDQYTYLIELDRFDIRNDGVISETNATGLTDAIKYAEEEGYKRVLFPKGTYVIKAPTPITIDSKNLIIDLNESTIKMQDEQYEESWKLMDVKETSENLVIENGTLEGNRFSDDFDYSNKYNEWTILMILGGDNITVDNIVFKDAPGYGIGTVTGNGSSERTALQPTHFELGNIDDEGALVDDDTTMRTNIFFDITKFGDQFEMGYILGYQGYPYLVNKEYYTYFYDEEENFITKIKCNQFVKSDIPKNAKYIKLVINQTELETPSTALAWISNVKGFRNSTVKNCTFEHNATLGLATGGQNIVYEGNKFIENGVEIDGNKARNPAAAVDLEDAWELMQNITFRNNIFEGNRFDIISCAGDGLVIENNYFDAGIQIYKRTTNYTVTGNIIDSKTTGFTSYESSFGGHVYGNTYMNARVSAYYVEWLSGPKDIEKEVAIMEEEKFINTQITLTSSNEVADNLKQVLKNSYITGKKEGTPFLKGIYDGCTFEDFTAYDLAIIKNSKIINSTLQCEDDTTFINTTMEDTKIVTQSASSITIDSSELTNTTIRANTWANPAVSISITNSTITNTNEEDNILYLSAGKAKDIVVSNNTINSINDVINIYDTTYSTPDGKLVAENNKVTIPEGKYFVTGKNVTSGSYSITLKNNTLSKGILINDDLKSSSYLKISISN